MDDLIAIGFFILSIVILLTGHVIRTMRWKLLLGPEHKNQLHPCLMALSLGYVVNAILPLRIGELVRAFYGSMQTRINVTTMLASIIVERAYDLMAVAFFVAVFVAGSFIDMAALKIVVASGISALVIFSGFYLVGSATWARKTVWHVANLFNARIRFLLLDTVLSLIEINRSVKHVWPRFVLQSLAMWVTYLLSYLALARAMHQQDTGMILDFFYAHLLTPITYKIVMKDKMAALLVAFYATAPCILVLGFDRLRQFSWRRLRNTVMWLSDPGLQFNKKTYHRFADATQYDAYLCRHFSGDESLTFDFETHAIQDATIIRRLAGGSEAITAVVQVDAALRIRKYAAMAAAKKLALQHAWLCQHGESLPVVQSINNTASDCRFFYDMPYSMSARDFYDFIHTNPVEKSWDILADILHVVGAFHDAHRGGEVSEADAVAYIDDKVVANFVIAKKAFPQLFDGDGNGDSVIINGTKIDLARIDRFCSPEFLLPRLTQRRTAVIHGDLTIENIIYDPALPRKWMLIDPNTANIMESPLLDYAKLFQSLHLGYEALNRNNLCTLSEEGIVFIMPRSQAYDELYRRLVAALTEKLGDEAIREIRLHEIIHYLRLIPYKIKKAPHIGLLFIGCLCLLIDGYFNDYETAQGK